MMANEPHSSTGTGRFVVLSDSPALDGTDPLEFEAMAGRLERIIVASRTSAPFTASIEAGWGAGKSTLMRRVQRRLEGKAPGQTQPPTDARTGGSTPGLLQSRRCSKVSCAPCSTSSTRT